MDEEQQFHLEKEDLIMVALTVAVVIILLLSAGLYFTVKDNTALIQILQEYCTVQPAPAQYNGTFSIFNYRNST